MEQADIKADIAPFLFRWEERHDRSMLIGVDEILGHAVEYQPTCTNGTIIMKDDQLVIEWDDGVNDTILDTKHGRKIIKECEVI